MGFYMEYVYIYIYILINICLISSHINSNIHIKKNVRPRRPSARNPGEQMTLKNQKRVFMYFSVFSCMFNAFQSFLICFQAFLLVRGGLRREIRVKIEILNI